MIISPSLFIKNAKLKRFKHKKVLSVTVDGMTIQVTLLRR